MNPIRYTLLLRGLKWVFSLLSIFFFFKTIKDFNWHEEFFSKVEEVFDKQSFGIITVLVMVVLNWNFEAQKFRVLLRDNSLSSIKVFFTVLGGMAISNFTPARSGEYIGRSLLLGRVHPVKVVMATVTGNLAQVTMTYFLGLISFIFVQMCFDFNVGWMSNTQSLLMISICALLFVFLIFSKRIIRYTLKKLPPKVRVFFRFIRHYNYPLFTEVLLLSFLRYLVFSVQLFLLFQFFSNFSLSWSAFGLIPIGFLLQSIVPVPAVSDIGIRVAVFTSLFHGLLSEAEIILSVTSLWLINLIIPGITGSLYLIGSNFNKA